MFFITFFFSLSLLFSPQSAGFTKSGAFPWLMPQGPYFGKAPPPALGYTKLFTTDVNCTIGVVTKL
jgi:hypothetical protein